MIDGYTIIYLKILWIICIYVWLKRSGRNPLCMNFDYGCLHNISVVTTVNFICVGPRRNQEKNTAKMARSFHFTFRYMDDVLSLNDSKFVIPPLPGGGGGILLYLCPSFRPSVRPSVRLSVLPSVCPSVRPKYFSSHFSQQLSMAEIWYLVTSFISVCHIVGSVFGPVRFLLPVCWLGWFLYTLNIYAHFSSHFSQKLLMTGIWYLVTSFI